jgi:predicted O-methyltransferase YrrM
LAELIVRAAKHDISYLPSWDHADGGFLSPRHERVLDTIGAIAGLLYTEDAQKLYELAWFSPGPVLEIGTYRGQSTAVMAAALADSGNPARIFSADIDAQALADARASLDRLGAGERVTLVHGEARRLLRALPRLRPGLVFVDGDHTLRGVAADLRALEPAVPTGSIVLLHDFEGYEDADPYAVRVAEAARRSWLASDAQFIGRFGLGGAYVRTAGGPAGASAPDLPGPALLELEGPATRMRRRLITLGRKLDRRLYHLRRG